jgi:hypothetical protein
LFESILKQRRDAQDEDKEN